MSRKRPTEFRNFEATPHPVSSTSLHDNTSGGFPVGRYHLAKLFFFHFTHVSLYSNLVSPGGRFPFVTHVSRWTISPHHSIAFRDTHVPRWSSFASPNWSSSCCAYGTHIHRVKQFAPVRCLVVSSPFGRSPRRDLMAREVTASGHRCVEL